MKRIGPGSLLAMMLACGGEPPDAADAGSRWPGLDPRFRGVGETLSHASFVGATGGAMLGQGPSSAFWTGPGLLAWGGVTSDFITMRAVRADTTEVRTVRFWIDGSTCPSTYSKILDAGAVVLALGGDPSRSAATCTFFGSDALGFTTSGGTGTTAEIGESASSTGGRASVITALVEVDAGVFTFVAESRSGAHESFETVVLRSEPSSLSLELSPLADAGYIVTASTWSGQDYTTVLTRRREASNPRREVRVWNTDPYALDQDIPELLASGYAPVSLGIGGFTLPDGGLALMLIGER